MRIKPKDVDYFEVEGIGSVYSKDGVYVFDESTRVLLGSHNIAVESIKNEKGKETQDFWSQARADWRRTHPEWARKHPDRRQASNEANDEMSVRPSNPNEVIGKALTTTGGVAIGIGVPCLIAGLTTCIIGHVGVDDANIIRKAACVEASYYLFGVGASLTLVSIPLFVSGQRIAEMEFNYTGNGVGISMNL